MALARGRQSVVARVLGLLSVDLVVWNGADVAAEKTVPIHPGKARARAEAARTDDDEESLADRTMPMSRAELQSAIEAGSAVIEDDRKQVDEKPADQQAAPPRSASRQRD